MRVLLAHKYFYVDSGNDFFFFEVGRVLEKEGHDVAWFSTLDQRNQPSEYSRYFVRQPVYRGGSILKRIWDFPRMVYSREAKRNFTRLLADFKPDIVHVFGIFVQISPSILDACRKAGVPVVMSCNDYKLICTNYRLYHHRRVCEDCKAGRHYMAILNKCCQESWAFSIASSLEAYVHDFLDIYRRNVHTFLFSSQFMARKKEEFWGKGAFRWRVLKNPFDPTPYACSEHYDDFCLYFGSLLDIKGVDIAIKAMSQVPSHMQLVVVGNGAEEDALKALVKELNLDNVLFVGPKWGDELTPYLQRARFVLVPSVWPENYPYVILEAFASGKAVVGSDRGGIPELVRDGGFGLVYPAQEPAELAGCIRQLWDMPDETVEMGRQARAHVEKEFNDTRFYETLMDIYGAVLT